MISASNTLGTKMIRDLFIRASIIVMVLINFGMAQQPARPAALKGTISGSVHDADYLEPIEYANIVIYRVQDSSQVTGTITNPGGTFRVSPVPAGTYYLEVSFIGYETRIINNIKITPAEPDAHVGRISLQASIIAVEGTGVIAERPVMTYEIDKKVVNVSRQTTVTSGSAVDVLENVPSVNVDIEGNVSLRGSENFTVLIDGRPTILEPSDALRQIPATMIDNIELITNPSVKYDPEGVSGIINVIMKKSTRNDISAIANSNVGLNNRYGGDFTLSYHRDKNNYFLGAYYNHGEYPGTSSRDSRTFANDSTWFVYSDGSSTREHTPYGIRGGIELSIADKNKMSLSGQYGKMSMQHEDVLSYDEWTEPGNEHEVYTSLEETNMGFRYYAAILDFNHIFTTKDHTLALHGYYSGRDRELHSTNELIDTSGTLINGQRNSELGPGQHGQIKIEYVQPVTEKNTFELGYQGHLYRSQDSTSQYTYDTVSGTYEYMSQYSHNVTYSRIIHGLYTMFSWTWAAFGAQTGLRAEYTDRLIEIPGEDEQFSVERLDYFPSLHLSYKLGSGQQFMTSYTRRIRRPRGWFLEPFLTWSDAYNVHSGNPELKPEYIDSYELGFQTFIRTSLLSSEIFYRTVHNRIERIQSIYSENVILHSVENIGTGHMFGVEIMLDLKLMPWWNLNCTGNAFQDWITGTESGDISSDDLSWSVRFSNEFKPFKTTTLQINGRYRGPSLTTQGQRAGYYTTDAALKQQLLGKTLAVTLQLRDVFGTGTRESTTETDEFYVHWTRTRKTPIISLSFQYTFNNYRPQRQTEQPEEEFEGIEEF
jgi:outer membrane cobalamin receptor